MHIFIALLHGLNDYKFIENIWVRRAPYSKSYTFFRRLDSIPPRSFRVFTPRVWLVPAGDRLERVNGVAVTAASLATTLLDLPRRGKVGNPQTGALTVSTYSV